LASSFNDPRVKVFYQDGARYVTEHPQSYEIIIVGGIAVTQCESFYLHQHVIQGVFAFAREVFPRLGYYYTLLPTYPSGLIGFYFCSLREDPHQEVDAERLSRLGPLKYYTPEIHRAAFTLPQFAADFFQP
jgi:spermidine synthase